MMKPCPPAKRWVGPSRARKRTKTRRAFPGTRAIGGRLRSAAVFNLWPGNRAAARTPNVFSTATGFDFAMPV